ncbi:hypothetical protein NW762_006374 [Fusarium torreyae]|uniref:Peptidase S8/S53 domain-containing protein n=1 Tax=Fusarium torreyae TaxID=1237075 RepID=A0A9W8VHI8_9HYPO|nr:hypothetical protein NW762_006374 [Fusarium torreyae]
MLPKQPEASELNSDCRNEVTDTTPHQQRRIEVLPREGRIVTDVATPASGTLGKVGPPNPVTEHDWLDRNTDGSVNSSKSTIKNLLEPVVVALIDDGVDGCDSDFAGRVDITDGKTFDYQDESVGQYYVSKARHGTEMARLILRVCPMASTYSIRLKTHTSAGNSNATIDPTSAALAIEAAFNEKAAIIPMRGQYQCLQMGLTRDTH